jgi:hypothetical protein
MCCGMEGGGQGVTDVSGPTHVHGHRSAAPGTGRTPNQ